MTQTYTRLPARNLDKSAGLLRPEDRATYPHVLIGLLRGLIDAVLEADEPALPGAALAAAARCFLRGAGRAP